MNGATETKGIILQNIDNRIRQIEIYGCQKGKVRGEKVHHIELLLGEMKESIKAINNKMFWGLIILLVLSFMAGINVWQEILKLVVS